MTTTQTPKVKNYNLQTASGCHIRIATMVRFSDGTEVKFMEKMDKREAIRQAEAQRWLNCQVKDCNEPAVGSASVELADSDMMIEPFTVELCEVHREMIDVGIGYSCRMDAYLDAE